MITSTHTQAALHADEISPRPEKNANRRVIPFDGISNFRDLGGYPTMDGRRVKWQTLFRSGHLSYSTKKDREALSQLGIHTIVDFRSDLEREREPDHLPPNHHIRTLSYPIQQDGMAPLSKEIRSLIENRALNGHSPSHKMRQLYTMLAEDYHKAYQQYFQALLDSAASPVLWHCSAGKDRAGFAAALLLKTLGVPDEIIMDDYMLSRMHKASRRRQLLTVTLLRGPKAGKFLKRMNDVDSTWLKTAFQAVDKKWGVFDHYIHSGIGLTTADIDELKNLYLDR